MNTSDELGWRFPAKAATALEPYFTKELAIGQIEPAPAEPSRIRGALIGFAFGEALGRPLEGRSRRWIESHFGALSGFVGGRPRTGGGTQLLMMTAGVLLTGAKEHPAKFAARLANAKLQGRGKAARHTQAELRAGKPWWQAASRSYGGTAAARAVAMGLIWAHDPQRAAFEAALSARVTHAHGAAVAGAAAFAAAVAFAASGEGRLGDEWLTSIQQVAAGYSTEEVDGSTIQECLALVRKYGELPACTGLHLLGTSSDVGHALPAALLAAMSVECPVASVFDAVQAGGDTDTIAAMAGACLGARFGRTAWPEKLVGPEPARGHPRTREVISGLGLVHDLARRIEALPSALTLTPRKAPNKTTPSPQGRAEIPVHVSFLIDRSGSMACLHDEVVSGYNEFVAEQRDTAGACRFTAVHFDSGAPFDLRLDRVPITEVPAMAHGDFQPGDLTPLFDALGRLIAHVETHAPRTQEDQVLVVFTDGLENASEEWTAATLRKRIQAKQTAGWSFIFMGANQDAYLAGEGLGIHKGNIQTFRGDGQGMSQAMFSVSRSVRQYRETAPEVRFSVAPRLFQDEKLAELDHLTRAPKKRKGGFWRRS
jgi:ADP-ribosylglycohydrolase